MECPICLTSAKGEFKIKTPCHHAFCLRCFLKLPNTLCPLCRRDFKKELPYDLKLHFHDKIGMYMLIHFYKSLKYLFF